MKKIFYVLMLFTLCAVTSSAQIVALVGTDTIGNGRTLTSTVVKVSSSNNPVFIWPVAQAFYDYTSGTADIAITGWYSLDNVKWDTIPGFAIDYSTDADYTAIWTTTSWETPIQATYVKWTARGHTGVQSGKPRLIWYYQTVKPQVP